MSNKVTGVVTAIRTFNTPKGATYSIRLSDGESYGCYTTAPPCNEGDTIEMMYKTNGNYRNAEIKTIRVITPAGANNVASSASVGTATPVSSGNTWGKSTEQQIIISKQAARNTAVEWITFLAANDALPVPASAKTPKAKYQFFEVFLEQVTDNFFNYSQGKDSGTKSSASGLSKASEGLAGLEDEAEWES